MYDIDVYVNIHLAKVVLCAYKLDCICKATRGYIFTHYITKKKKNSDKIYLRASERKLLGIVEIYQSKPMVEDNPVGHCNWRGYQS